MDVSKETRAVHTGAPIRPCTEFLKEVYETPSFLKLPYRGIHIKRFDKSNAWKLDSYVLPIYILCTHFCIEKYIP